jgi:hypothetical protein
VRTTDFGDPVFPSYDLRSLNGVPVAVIGQAFPYTPIANPRYFVPDWTFGIQDENLQKVVDEVREAADLAVGAGCLLEVEVRERMGAHRAAWNVERLQQVLADQVRGLAGRRTDADVDARLAEVQRHQLRVAVGEMEQADVAERRLLVEALGGVRLGREHAAAIERHPGRRSGGQQLQEVAPGEAHEEATG